MPSFRLRWRRADDRSGVKYGYRHAGTGDGKTGPELEFKDRESAEVAAARLNEQGDVYHYEVERK